jgi:hypothetical protein
MFIHKSVALLALGLGYVRFLYHVATSKPTVCSRRLRQFQMDQSMNPQYF